MTLDRVTLGPTGLQVAPLRLGTWRFGKETGGVLETGREDAPDLLDAYADRGGDFVDITGTLRVPVSCRT